MNENKMPDTEMLEEYDFRGGRGGVYAERYAQGTNLATLALDSAEMAPESEDMDLAEYQAASEARSGAMKRAGKANPRRGVVQ